MKEGAGILHQIYRFTGGVNSWGSRIHQSKSWYYLGPSQTSKMEFFGEIVFSYKPLTLLEKRQPICLTGSTKLFQKILFMFLLVKS